MTRDDSEQLKYLGGALGIHVLLGVLLFAAGLIHRQPIQPSLTLKAVMVDKATLDQLAKSLTPPTVPEPQPAPAPVEAKPREPDPAQAKQQRELEEQRKQAQLQREQAEQQRQSELKAKQQAEVERQQREAERQAAEAEQKRKQQEAEKKRIAEIQQKQREAEARRQAEMEAKAQQSREAELAAQLAAEESRATAVNAGLLNQYVAMIQQRVMRNWNKPPTARAGLECEVKVTQAMGGTVLSVALGRCNGDQAVRTSIENAVNAASPLPMPPDARLFERNLTFLFKPTD